MTKNKKINMIVDWLADSKPRKKVNMNKLNKDVDDRFNKKLKEFEKLCGEQMVGGALYSLIVEFIADELSKERTRSYSKGHHIGYMAGVMSLKVSGKKLLAKQKEGIKMRIGMLRQWLNEDKITEYNKMVTNEDLEYWLIKEL